MSSAVQSPATPIAFWFWNGTLTLAEVTRQAALMREAGVNEFVIHARKGFGDDSGLKTPYLGEAWFDACTAAIEEAHRSGMKVWLYDEINWPSGSAGGRVTIEQGLSEWHIDEAGELSQKFDVEWKTMLSPDFLSRRAAEAFLASTHEEYAKRYAKYFGTTIVGVFNDEIRFANANVWSPDLPDHRGFTTAGRVRETGRVFREVYLRTLSDWCEAHGLKHMGHVMGEETLGSQVRYLGGDVMALTGQYHVPGIDQLGTKAEGLQPIYLASAAYLKGGNPVTMCETGAALPWDMQEVDLRRVTGWLYAHGVARQVLHGFFYEENKKDWSPDMFFRWQHWDQMKAYTAWATRWQSLRDQLEPTYEVALYFPVEEFIDDYEPNAKFTLDFKSCDPIAGQRALELHRAMQALPNALKQGHINFVFVPRAELSRARDLLLVVPSGCETTFAGHVEFERRVLFQRNLSPTEVAAEVRRLLPGLPSVSGARSVPHPLPVRDDLADPYLHLERDEGGVVLKTYRLDGKAVITVWNAEPSPFVGTVQVALHPDNSFWTVDGLRGDTTSLRAKDGSIAVTIPPFELLVLSQEGASR